MPTSSDQQIILGIDPGTRVTGYGVIQQSSQNLKLLDFGCIRTSSEAQSSKRYFLIFQSLCQLIEQHQPDAVAVETQFVHKNAQSAIKLAMARAAVLIASAQHDTPLFEYTPRKAKKAAVGHGGASKTQIQKMLQLRFNMDRLPEPEDAADALAIALCHANTIAFHSSIQGQILCTPTSKGL